MKIRAAYYFAMASIFFSSRAAAQTGSVTFYTTEFPVKQQLKDVVVPKGTIPFTGWVYDGKKRLAHSSKGRFVTFQVPTGAHDFSATYNFRGPGKTILHLEVESGGHHCVRLSGIVNAVRNPGFSGGHQDR